jgi:hypothetical protein
MPHMSAKATDRNKFAAEGLNRMEHRRASEKSEYDSENRQLERYKQ